jgi:hypothetical protein
MKLLSTCHVAGQCHVAVAACCCHIAEALLDSHCRALDLLLELELNRLASLHVSTVTHALAWSRTLAYTQHSRLHKHTTLLACEYSDETLPAQAPARPGVAWLQGPLERPSWAWSSR